jgi:squalene-hopene/tetraprenyl-beta-curcumene cyclase
VINLACFNPESRMFCTKAVSFVAACLAVALAAAPVFGQKAVGPDAKQLRKLKTAGQNYLRTTQADDGTWTSPKAVGITGLIVAALLESGLPPSDAMVAKGLKALEKQIQNDGGIYYRKSQHRNYETCICLMAFAAANTDGKYTKNIKNAENFLRKLQWDEGEGLESSDAAYGGAGYGSHSRPDLSNTSFLIEALKKAGVKSDDPAIQKALIFVSRTQNLESEHNNTKHAAKVNDGGLYYTPAAGGSSQAGKTPDGGLRSYGSMTYAGLKSMIYAGLDEKDKRVKAAHDWIRKNYALENNPGLGQNGLYYYYQTFAKTLSVMKLDHLKDAKGVKHDWRKELTAQLAKQQRKNGSWVNKAPRWYEGDPNLSTAYALLALSYCEPK